MLSLTCNPSNGSNLDMTEIRAQAKTNPHSKPAYPAANEPWALFGLDWRGAALAAVPAVLLGMFGHSTLAGIVTFFALAPVFHRLFARDTKCIEVFFYTLGEKKYFGVFGNNEEKS